MRHGILSVLLLFIFVIPAFAETSYFQPDIWYESTAMQLVYDTNIEKIVSKMQKAVSEKSEWFRDYSAEYSGEGALPYHSNLGITEEEYYYLIQESGTSTKLEPTGQFEMMFKSLGGDRYEVVTDIGTTRLDGIILNFQLDEVDTEFGTLQAADDVNNEDPQSPAGEWIGDSWRIEQGQFVDGNLIGDCVVAQFSVGIRKAGSNILYYDAKKFSGNNLIDRVTIIIYF